MKKSPDWCSCGMPEWSGVRHRKPEEGPCVEYDRIEYPEEGVGW